jgi:hypothetical protein
VRVFSPNNGLDFQPCFSKPKVSDITATFYKWEMSAVIIPNAPRVDLGSERLTRSAVVPNEFMEVRRESLAGQICEAVYRAQVSIESTGSLPQQLQSRIYSILRDQDFDPYHLSTNHWGILSTPICEIVRAAPINLSSKLGQQVFQIATLEEITNLQREELSRLVRESKAPLKEGEVLTCASFDSKDENSRLYRHKVEMLMEAGQVQQSQRYSRHISSTEFVLYLLAVLEERGTDFFRPVFDAVDFEPRYKRRGEEIYNLLDETNNLTVQDWLVDHGAAVGVTPNGEVVDKAFSKFALRVKALCADRLSAGVDTISGLETAQLREDAQKHFKDALRIRSVRVKDGLDVVGLAVSHAPTLGWELTQDLLGSAIQNGVSLREVRTLYGHNLLHLLFMVEFYSADPRLVKFLVEQGVNPNEERLKCGTAIPDHLPLSNLRRLAIAAGASIESMVDYTTEGTFPSGTPLYFAQSFLNALADAYSNETEEQSDSDDDDDDGRAAHFRSVERLRACVSEMKCAR